MLLKSCRDELCFRNLSTATQSYSSSTGEHTVGKAVSHSCSNRLSLLGLLFSNSMTTAK